MRAILAAGFEVAVSPRGTHAASAAEIVLVVWVRNSQLSARQFEEQVRAAVDGLAFVVETSLLRD